MGVTIGGDAAKSGNNTHLLVIQRHLFNLDGFLVTHRSQHLFYNILTFFFDHHYFFVIFLTELLVIQNVVMSDWLYGGTQNPLQ